MEKFSFTKECFDFFYTQKRMSIPDISKINGKSTSTTRYWLMKFGVPLRTRADGVRASAYKIAIIHRGRKRIFSAAHKKSISRARTEWANRHSKGISLKPSGYWEFTRGENKHRRVHVVLAEKHILGRRIKIGEHVHHKDENKLNNNLSNLQVLTISEHMRHHAILNHSKRKRDKYGKFT